jgi:Guanine nucleotide exchange factor synembryn
MSRFQRRLSAILSSSFANDVEYGKNEEEYCKELTKWNEDFEVFVETTVQQERHQKQKTSSTSDDDDTTTGVLIQHDSVFHDSVLMQSLVLSVASGRNLIQAMEDAALDRIQQGDLSNRILDALTNDWTREKESISKEIPWLHMFILFRTIKNWWRWYMQLYLPFTPQYPVEIQDRITRQEIETSWRSKRLLELLLNMLEEILTKSLQEHRQDCSCHLQAAQYVTQLFFYITYPTSSNDLFLMDAYHYMITECNILDRFLVILIRNDIDMRLRLSIIRNVHNGVSSFPEISTKAVMNAVAETSSTSVQWIEDNGIVTYKLLFRDLAFYLVSGLDSYTTEVAATIDNSEDNFHRNVELLVEILRCSYALRLGSDSDHTNQRWHMVIEKALQLDTTTNMHVYDCQLAITCVLMENVAFRNALSSDSFECLLHILEVQVMIVLQEKYIDDRAAAALNPILLVIFKLCTEFPDRRMTTSQRVFPIQECDHDINDNTTLAQEEAPRNMAPIDAPEGTLRWNLIQLLTWPNSFVKRLTGELLFLLCHNNQQEFVRRVGIGNAVTTLSLKGLIDLPDSVNS